MIAFYIIAAVLILLIWIFLSLVTAPLVKKAKEFMKLYSDYLDEKENEE